MQPDRLVATPDLSQLPLAQLQAMREAGAEMLECRRVLARAGLNLVGEVLRDALNRGETFYEFDHYPHDDVYDHDSHAQYYYHSHRSEIGEHGHFHTFLRPAGMPAGVAPLSLPSASIWPQGDDALAHLAAVAMDASGWPTALFTVNRWVTGDAWYPAEQVIAMLERFRIDHANPSWPLNRWLGALFVLFRPHLQALLERRDQTVRDWAAAHPGTDVFEDRALDVTSQMPVSVETTLALVERAIAAHIR
ncbi:MAG: hypothetical protein PHH47_04245 [Gallionella sp.]|nr:hypothetical protein [Gallionella sp.]MDD4945606.1 hypothetical protein [Gallionella sp.]